MPATLRDRARIDLPEGLTELAVRKRLGELATGNATALDWSLFLGGGIYHHFIPSAVDATVSRSEFSTSYTPYQPEVSQGTLQALFEFQTMICQLAGMEVANAGVYDGASAAAEAALMSRRIQPLKRRRVLVSRALHPQYRAVIASYLKNLKDVRLEEIPFDATGATDVGELAQRLNDQAMCVLVGYPNFFGVIEDLAPIQAACAKAGAQLIYCDDGSARARPAQAAGGIRCRHRGRRGTEFGRADEPRWPSVWFFYLSEEICPEHSGAPCWRDR